MCVVFVRVCVGVCVFFVLCLCVWWMCVVFVYGGVMCVCCVCMCGVVDVFVCVWC